MKNLIIVSLLLFFITSCNLGKEKFPDGKTAIFEGSPRINKPSVTGNLPNTPFLFAIPTGGKRPIEWKVSNLPSGLSVDAKTGFITGQVKEAGTYKVEITATNALGSDTKPLSIVIGETLALTPPMGWNSWNTFTNKVTDSLVRQIADSMVSLGMRDLGYQYVNIDDFWQMPERGADGHIQVNKEKFPDGMKAVADYVHSKGLKLGVYSDAADRTCGGVAGSFQHEEQDAADFAEWGVDLLKYDYCNAPSARDTAIERYTRMSKALRKTNRSIVFSICEWGEGGIETGTGKGNRKAFEWAPAIQGNYWRTTLDIRNAWELKVYNDASNSIMQIVDINAPLAKYASHGHWNDPDMLVVGIVPNPSSAVFTNGATGCTDEEYRSHMSLWCLMASPLLCGNDLRSMSPATKETLLNPEIIAVNQDELGKQAERIIDNGDEEVFAKPMADGSWVVGLLNRNNDSAKKMKINWADLKITGKHAVRDLWQNKNLGEFADGFETEVPVHGCTVLRIY